jgi:8-oxo-dGTP diphosphatase
VAAAALVDEDSRVLVATRPERKSMAGLWEFPGGKVEPGETPEACLVRELEEELGIVTKPPCLAPLSFASHPYPTFHLLMPLFVCRVWDGEPTPREGQQIRWLRPKELFTLPMPEADRPLLRFLDELL